MGDDSKQRKIVGPGLGPRRPKEAPDKGWLVVGVMVVLSVVGVWLGIGWTTSLLVLLLAGASGPYARGERMRFVHTLPCLVVVVAFGGVGVLWGARLSSMGIENHPFSRDALLAHHEAFTRSAEIWSRTCWRAVRS